jgi:hypothetical protein
MSVGMPRLLSRNVNLGAEASHGFVDGIIHDFLHQMMQTSRVS